MPLRRFAILFGLSSFLVFGALPGCGGSSSSTDAGAEDASNEDATTRDVGTNDATVEDVGAGDSSTADTGTGDASTTDDAGTTDDSGATGDAATTDDSGTTSDSGTPDDAGGTGDAGNTDDAGQNECPTVSEDEMEPDSRAAPIPFGPSPFEAIGRTLTTDDEDAFTTTIPGGCVAFVSWSHDGEVGATWQAYVPLVSSNPVMSGAFTASGQLTLPAPDADLEVVLGLRDNGGCLTYDFSVALACQ